MHRVWLIRHGQSVANAGGPSSDPATIPLTERGHVQASRLAGLFGEPPSVIVTSSYLRTKETAAPTMARFAEPPCEEWNVHEFTYLAPKRFVDTTFVQRLPHVNEFWTRSDPEFVDGEGAESFATLMRRVDDLLAQLRSRSEGDFVAVFTHGQFMRAVAWATLALSEVRGADAMRRFRAYESSVVVHNTAVLELEFVGGQPSIGAFVAPHLPTDLLTR